MKTSPFRITKQKLSPKAAAAKKRRDKALDMLAVSLQVAAEDLGYKIIFANIRINQIINLGKRFGWTIDPKPNYTHIKIL